MVDGFQMYLDEHGNKLGGVDVKFIVEDEQGKPDTAVTKAKKLVLQDKVHFFIGGLLASTGYALAPVSTAEKTIYISSVSSADDLTQRDLPKYPYFLRTSWTSSQPQPSARPMGLRPGLQEGRHDRRRLCVRLRVGRRLPDARSRPAAARSCRRSGRRSAPRTSGPISRHSRRTPTRSSSLMVGPMALQFPKQLRGRRQQEADRRRRRQL